MKIVSQDESCGETKYQYYVMKYAVLNTISKIQIESELLVHMELYAQDFY
jgi:hypothetical protein